MSIQDLTTGTGERLQQAADLAGMNVDAFMQLSAGKQAFWFGQLAETVEGSPEWHAQRHAHAVNRAGQAITSHEECDWDACVEWREWSAAGRRVCATCAQPIISAGPLRYRHLDDRIDGHAPQVKLANRMDADPFAPWADEEAIPLEVALEPYEQKRQDRKAAAEELGTLVRTYGSGGAPQIEVWVAADRVTFRDLDKYGAEVRQNVIGPEALAEMGVTAAEFAKAYEEKPADDEVAES